MDVFIVARRGYGDRAGNLHPHGARISLDDHLALKLIRNAIATPVPTIVAKPAKAKKPAPAAKPAPSKAKAAAKTAGKSMTKETFIGKEDGDE